MLPSCANTCRLGRSPAYARQLPLPPKEQERTRPPASMPRTCTECSGSHTVTVGPQQAASRPRLSQLSAIAAQQDRGISGLSGGRPSVVLKVLKGFARTDRLLDLLRSQGPRPAARGLPVPRWHSGKTVAISKRNCPPNAGCEFGRPCTGGGSSDAPVGNRPEECERVCRCGRVLKSGRPSASGR
jgi:hypothetical protein